jgi:hypothetical protein
VTKNIVTFREDQDFHRNEGFAVGRESPARKEDNKTRVFGALVRKGRADGHGE